MFGIGRTLALQRLDSEETDGLILSRLDAVGLSNTRQPSRTSAHQNKRLLETFWWHKVEESLRTKRVRQESLRTKRVRLQISR